MHKSNYTLFTVRHNLELHLSVKSLCRIVDFDLHLGSVLVNKQLDTQFFFYMYLFQFSTCFEHHCAHHQENQLY
jgi:hypothetical protein